MNPRSRAHYYSKPASREEVLAALKDAGGTWTASEMFTWGTRNGGTDAVFAALRWWVRKGRITYTPNLWVVV